MKKIAQNFSIILLMLILTNCGFKVVDKTKLNNFSIKEITSSGDKRINFKIKNNLSINTAKQNDNKLLVSLKTKKNKIIKEKNIKNEIIKYQILLTAEIDFNLIKVGKMYKEKVVISGDYLVGDNYSITIANEKKLVDQLVEDISEKILNKINKKLNDI